jgi:hypothetical protein
MTENEWIPIIVTLVAFVIGYGIVNWIILLLKTKPTADQKTSASTSSEPPPSPPPPQETREEQARKEHDRQDQARKEQERQWKEEQQRRASASSQTYSEEAKYGTVLGLKGKVTPADVKRAYRELLLKYHPDKVSHLGIEFHKIAEEKTKDIIVAYEYFKKRYNFE